jgi:hypothetical protein
MGCGFYTRVYAICRDVDAVRNNKVSTTDWRRYAKFMWVLVNKTSPQKSAIQFRVNLHCLNLQKNLRQK